MSANPKFSAAWRRGILAKIHIAKAQLGMSRDEYEAMLQSFGVTSSADLDARGLDRLLRRFETLGFKPANVKKRGRDRTPDFGKSRIDKSSYISKIEALLAEIGRREGRFVPWDYANAILKRQCGVETLDWAYPKQLGAVIVALKRRLEKLEDEACLA